jgi:hypothetical protein
MPTLEPWRRAIAHREIAMADEISGTHGGRIKDHAARERRAIKKMRHEKNREQKKAENQARASGGGKK